MWAVWKYCSSIHLWVSWRGVKAAHKIRRNSKCVSWVLPSFDPQLEADHENEHQRPWTTFSEIFTHTPNYPHTQNTITIALGMALTPCYTLKPRPPLCQHLLLLFLVSQWLCPSSIFSANLFFISPHPWQHLGFVSTFLPSVPLRGSLKGVVDCTVPHTAVIQCYWGCYNSVLCDQEG